MGNKILNIAMLVIAIAVGTGMGYLAWNYIIKESILLVDIIIIATVFFVFVTRWTIRLINRFTGGDAWDEQTISK